MRKSSTYCEHFQHLNLQKIQKLTEKLQNDSTCQTCKQKGGNVEKKLTEITMPKSLWICLSCGNLGCGRFAEKHALDHYETKKAHHVAIDIYSLMTWCYTCDIALDELKLLEMEERDKAQLDDFINKVQGIFFKKNAEIRKGDQDGVMDMVDDSKLEGEESKEDLSMGMGMGMEEGKPTKAPEKEEPSYVTCVRGLNNLGNTCFFNSTMQCLNATVPLVKYYMNDMGQEPEFHNTRAQKQKKQNMSLNLALKNFFVQIRMSKTKGYGGYNPQDVFSGVVRVSNRFRGWQQQDAHDLFMELVDGLFEEQKKLIMSQGKLAEGHQEKEIRRINVTHTPIGRIIGSLLCNKVICGECKNISWTFDPCVGLSLPIVQKKLGWSAGNAKKTSKMREDERLELVRKLSLHEEEKHQYQRVELKESPLIEKNDACYEPEKRVLGKEQEINTVQDCLAKFTEKEHLHGRNKYYCDVCNKGVDKKNPILTEAIKEFFIFDPPPILILHLKRFSQSGFYLSKNSKRIKFPLELNIDDFVLHRENKDSKEASQLEACEAQGKLGKYNYSLYGIVTHSGGMHGGHYVAYTKQGGQWYYFSDSHFSETSEKQVLNTEAYILFYQRHS